jgi:NADH-quinone oxidoreductase subunit M
MPNILSTVIFLPLVGVFVLLLIKKEHAKAIRSVAFLFSLATFFLSLYLFYKFDPSAAGMQFEEKRDWIRLDSLNITYHLGIDGISLLLILLTTFLTPLALLFSWESIATRVKSYFIFMLLLETGMIGVFASLDLILFYFFWEAMLIPMYFIIGVWGGERRIYAAIKFILYTMFGSLLMLVAMIYLFKLSGGKTFDLLLLLDSLSNKSLILTEMQQLWLFLAFFLAFAIKVPLFPFHTWLPDAHVEAPTAGSVILAGVLLKMGTYGLLRFCLPLFPDAAAELAPLISVLAVIGIIYGALVAMVQPDLKKLVAYSSVSHLGLVVLGIFAFTAQGIEGAVYQMLNHGLSTGALFLIVGMLYDRRHTRLIEQFGGVAHRMPVLAAFFMLVTLSSIGLPLLNGFVGEFLILQGTFLSDKMFSALATSGMVLSAVYMLWMYQRAILGEITNPANEQLKDINLREKAILIPIAIMIIFMGVYTSPFLRKMDKSVNKVVQQMEGVKGTKTKYRVSR